MTHDKNERLAFEKTGAIGTANTPERAKCFGLDEHDDRDLARIARIARAESGLTREQYGAVLGRSDKSIEKDEDSTHQRCPNARDELNMPQEAFLAHVREMILARHRRGFPLVEITEAPRVRHATEADRVVAITLEATDVQRALVTGAPDHVVIKEAREMVDQGLELIASRQQRAA